jgi:hypothetical protein
VEVDPDVGLHCITQCKSVPDNPAQPQPNLHLVSSCWLHETFAWMQRVLTPSPAAIVNQSEEGVKSRVVVEGGGKR